MPFPSTACQECRTRRIKCDGATPVCQRCARSGRICQGVKPAFSIIHTENAYASGQKKRPRGPRTSPKALPKETLASILPRQPYDLQTEAVVYYVRFHLESCTNVPGILTSFRDDLVPIWTSKAGEQVLDLAISSVALAMFSRMRGCAPAAIEASKKYEKLLRALHTSISSLSANNIEVCLLASHLMAMYEDILQTPDETEKGEFVNGLRSVRHHDGMLALLKFWKERLSARNTATKVIKHARRAAIKSSLLRRMALPAWLEKGDFFGEQGLELEYDILCGRIALLRHKLGALIAGNLNYDSGPERFAEKVESLNQEAQAVDETIMIWSSHFPPASTSRRHILSNSPREKFFSPIVYSYPNLMDAAIWNRYYATRVLINSTRINILQLISSPSLTHHSQQSECLFTIHAMADNIAASIPFGFERFKVSKDGVCSRHDGILDVFMHPTDTANPYMVGLNIYPLTIVTSIAHIDEEQKTWFKSQLAQMGRMTGYVMFERVETDHWLKM